MISGMFDYSEPSRSFDLTNWSLRLNEPNPYYLSFCHVASGDRSCRLVDGLYS